MDQGYAWAAQYVLAMFAGALNAKALAVVIAYCIGMQTLYPDWGKSLLLSVFFVPAYLLAAFRD